LEFFQTDKETRTIEGNRRIEPSVGRMVIKNERQYRITLTPRSSELRSMS
jgi:hypothetical protein